MNPFEHAADVFAPRAHPIYGVARVMADGSRWYAYDTEGDGTVVGTHRIEYPDGRVLVHAIVGVSIEAFR